KMVDHVHGDLAIDEAEALQRHTLRPRGQVERVTGPARQRPALGTEDLRGDGVAEAIDLLLEEPRRGLQEPQAGLAALHERPLALEPVDQMALLEACQRLAHGR